jgi:uncharacterized iron-regulated membrane protein
VSTTQAEGAPASTLYRAVWRWHFIAGLLTLPFLLLLAVTGGIYLFKDEIDRFVHRDLLVVAPAAVTLSPEALAARALAVHPGTLATFVMPAAPDASAEVRIIKAGGEKLSVYVDPHDGRVLGAIPTEEKLMEVVRKLHSLAYFGTLANHLIELAAGWTIVLVVSGIYLWWPRGGSGGVVTLRGRPPQRLFWRDLHAVTGAFAGALVLFLAVSGMPWSVFWGAEVQRIAGEAGLGYPKGVWDQVPTSAVPHQHGVSKAPWTLGQAPMPVSATPEAGAMPIGLDRAVAIFSARGFAPGFAVDLPAAPDGVYSATVFPDDLARQQVAHLDQYSGKVLLDVHVADYGAVARAVEWGVNVHLGQEYGLANQLAMLCACLAMLALVVSSAVMWWKRRPAHALGVPAVPANLRVGKGAALIAVTLGAIYPLVGASMVLMVLVEWILPGGARPRLA